MDALAAHSSRWRIAPEMMFALQTEVSARQLVDGYTREELGRRPNNARKYARCESHERWTAMLAERLEILKREYEKRYDNATASLAAICDEMLRVSLAD